MEFKTARRKRLRVDAAVRIAGHAVLTAACRRYMYMYMYMLSCSRWGNTSITYNNNMYMYMYNML